MINFEFRKILHRRLLRIATRFKKLWKNYLYQSLLASIVIAVIFWILHMQEAVIIASIGASAFIVFTLPNTPTAKSRRVIGGHMIGLLCGSLASIIIPQTVTTPVIVIEYALAVGFSIFLMVALDFEHPPAAGTALGVAISQFSPDVAITVLTSSILLSIARRVLKKYLRDLL